MAVEPAALADIRALIELVNEQLNPDGPHDVIPHDPNGRKYLVDVFEALIRADRSRATVFVIRDLEGTSFRWREKRNTDELQASRFQLEPCTGSKLVKAFRRHGSDGVYLYKQA
jgi:hypothetical protein